MTMVPLQCRAAWCRSTEWGLWRQYQLPLPSPEARQDLSATFREERDISALSSSGAFTEAADARMMRSTRFSKAGGALGGTPLERFVMLLCGATLSRCAYSPADSGQNEAAGDRVWE